MTEQQFQAAVFATLLTIWEVDSERPVPQSPIFMAMQNRGYSMDDYQRVLRGGCNVGLWTITTETVALTDKGRKLAFTLAAKMAELL